MRAARDAYGEVLVELGKENENIVVLDADLSSSTKTAVFAKAFPERFFNMGIAEANMMGVAAGLASAGKVPFASTFAVFATGRVYDQIRQSIAYAGFNVKIVATHGGLTVGPDGATHQALEDIALMRVLPGMTVIVPSDAEETKQAVRASVDHMGPVYIRLGREAVPDVFPAGAVFEIGKGNMVRPDVSREQVIAAPPYTLKFDVSFIACGVMVKECLDAASILESEGIKAAVAGFASIKPFDADLCLALARQSRLIVAAEEHSVIGGLGGAVCECLAENHPARVLRIGVNDRFGESGSARELLAAYGLTGSSIAEKVMAALR
ncbi:MAG: transketolase family protein [Bacillota bacterium]|jgi:transketolase|nr:transketolase family protein [Candidatus Fermentithermobacillaceae bacterium]